LVCAPGVGTGIRRGNGGSPREAAPAGIGIRLSTTTRASVNGSPAGSNTLPVIAAPFCNCRLTSIDCPAVTVTAAGLDASSVGARPAFCASMRYVPGVICSKAKCPSGSVIACRGGPIGPDGRSGNSEMRAPLTGAPVPASVTRPEMRPVWTAAGDWARDNATSRLISAMT
jgi:hypothetical protein